MRFAAFVIGLLVLAASLPGAAPARVAPRPAGQNDPALVPADPELDRIMSETSLFAATFAGAAAGPLAGPVWLMFEGNRIVAQSILWQYRLQVDDALRQAWTTHTLLALDRQIRGAQGMGSYLVAKLTRDQKHLQTNPLDGDLKQVQAALDTIQDPQRLGLEQKGTAMVETFDRIRKRAIGGYIGGRIMTQDTTALGRTMLAFTRALADAERLATRLSVADAPSTQPASPMKDVRLDVTNDSTSLVFFFRVWERGAGGAYAAAPRRDTERWIVVYPREAAGRVTAEAPNFEAAKAGMPSQLWIPVKLADRVEVRVATYGPARERIRFQQIRGAQVRPELSALERGFYWWAYELYRSDTDRLVSRWYPMRESYTWSFDKGIWIGGKGVTWMPTNPRELREVHTAGFTLTQDHFAFVLPDDLPAIDRNPLLEAAVAGEADMFQRTAKGEVPQPKETGSGTLRIRMRRW